MAIYILIKLFVSAAQLLYLILNGLFKVITYSKSHLPIFLVITVDPE